MNSFRTIHTEYLRASRTIETVLVSKDSDSKIFFVYNYEGNSFRVFENLLSLTDFFQNKAQADFCFDSDAQLDCFLAETVVKIL